MTRSSRFIAGTAGVVAALFALVGVGAAAPTPAPANTVSPSLTGTPQEGQILKSEPGSWQGIGHLDFAYQWLRCDLTGASCTPIQGATDGIYAPASLDIGRTLVVAVTAMNGAGAKGQASSKPTTQVTAASPDSARNLTAPKITGKEVHGQTLTAQPGTWTGPQPVTFRYRWRLCDANGSDCRNTSTSGPAYRLGANDAGHRLRVLVEARNRSGSSYALSDPSGKVKPAGGDQGQAGAPRIASAPGIGGKPQEGETLAASTGSWHGDQPIDFSYQWRRCDSHGSGCSNISHANDKLYTLGRDDVGHRLRLVVTAVNKNGTSSGVSPATGVVSAAPANAPTTSSQPRVTGQAQEGQVLTAQGNTFNGTAPIAITYRWRSCDAKGGDCQNTPVTTQTYTLAANDVGHTLRVVVTATNKAGASDSISDPTAVVTAKQTQGGTPTSGTAGALKLANGTTSIPVTSVALPQRLIVDRIEASPSVITSRSQPLVVRFRVVDTRGFVVRDALVYAAGVPFDRLTAAPEVQTGQDGWATVTFQIKPTFSLRHGNLVVIFVRARKAGDGVLAGVSTRRLVSIRVG